MLTSLVICSAWLACSTKKALQQASRASVLRDVVTQF